MIDQGIVHSVQIVTLGSRLAADAAIGATSLTVDDVSDFNEDGGTLSLNGVQYPYTSANFEADTITLSTGLTAAAVAVDRVDVWPLTPEKQALVMTAGAEDALTVRVPHSLMALMPEGIRDEGTRESVQFTELGGEFVITDVLGKEAVVEAAYIDSALTDALAANDAALATLNNVTLPALQTEVDAILPITATEITDGEITTPKLAALAVTAAKIAAGTITATQIAGGTITANELAADSVTANKIQADAINGKTITGALIRTVATGQRVEMNTTNVNRLSFYSGVAGEVSAGRMQSTSPAAGQAQINVTAPMVTGVVTPSELILSSRSDTSSSQANLTADAVGISSTGNMNIDAGNVLDITGNLLTYNASPVVTAAATQTLTNKTIPTSDIWHEVGNATTGLGTTLAAGYTNVGGAYPTLQFHKDATGTVWIVGRLAWGGAATTTTGPFTLPVGYRPSILVPCMARTNATTPLIIGVNVNPDGTTGYFNALPVGAQIFFALNFPTR